MGRSKQDKFAIIAQSENVIEEGKDWYTKIKGNWNIYFKNDNPIVLELGCGKGDYTIGMAALFSQINFIGIDIKGSRIWKGSSIAAEKQLENAAFLRIKIDQIDQFFAEGEVDKIWITFPDPRPRDKDEKHRLTCDKFMATYRKILKTEGLINLKTDSDFLFDYTLDLIKNSQTIGARNLVYTADVYQSELLKDHYGLTTAYERMFLGEGKKIKYLKFNL